MPLVLACPLEINGFGYVSLVQDPVNGDRIYVDEVFSLPQTVTATSATTDPQALDAHLMQMVRDGKPTEALRLQWHSHVWGEAYCSGTDVASIDAWPGEWLVSLVVNKYGNRYARLDTFRGGMRLGMEMEIDIVSVIPPAVMARAVTDVQRLVRQAVPVRRFVSRSDAAAPVPGAEVHEMGADTVVGAGSAVVPFEEA